MNLKRFQWKKKGKMEMTQAIFLDRDGTIIKDNGHIRTVSDVQFYEYTFDCLRMIQNDFLLFIITNQPGIAKGIISEKDVVDIHSYIIQQLKEKGIEMKEIYYCPHKKEDNCQCRKPNPFFVLQASKKYSIDIGKSFVIGDHPSDVELAINCKAKSIYLLTGHGRKHYNDLTDNIKNKTKVCQNLMFATRTIIKMNNIHGV